MSDINCQHPLHNFFTQRTATRRATDPGIHVAVKAEMSFINFRGDAGSADFCARIEMVFGQPLPQVANTWTDGPHAIYWLGPDEWLAVTPAGPGQSEAVGAPLLAQLQEHSIAATTQHGGLLQLNIKGDNVRDLLAKGSTLDFHPSAFGVGQCAQTGLGKGNVLVAIKDMSPEFTLIVRRSFAPYTALWLAHAGDEFGIDFAVDT